MLLLATELSTQNLTDPLPPPKRTSQWINGSSQVTFRALNWSAKRLSFIQRNTMDKLQAGHSNWIAWNRIETKGMLTSNVLETAALTR